MRKTFIIISFVLVLFYLCGNAQRLQAEQATPEEQPNQSPAQKITPIGNINILGSYSRVLGGGDVSGLYLSGNFAPVVALDSKNYLIPLYNGLYKKQRQIINEEEGGRLYTDVISHNFSLMHKHLYPAQLTQRFSGFLSLNYNKETADESFGNGLYDYRDYGLSFDLSRQLRKTENNTDTLLLGTKYFFRQYPNFQTLLSLSGRTASEENEKDQNIWGIVSRYRHQFSDQLALALSYDYLFKQFADKLTIDRDGILTDRNRLDNVHLWRLNTQYKLNENIVLGLDGQIELNNSNQNHYDSNNTAVDFSDDTFIPHYFNYHEYEYKPSLTLIKPLAENRNAALTIAYAYTLRDYPNRNVQDAQGIYQSQTQEDKIHSCFLNIKIGLNDKLSLITNFDYAHTTSNMEYEQYYRYDYDTYQILSGISYRF